ncbi:ATPase, partial [Streptomyces erythrochromogenes]
MQLRGRKRSTAAAMAVIGSLLGGAVASAPPGFLAGPSAPDGPTAAPGTAGAGGGAGGGGLAAPGPPRVPGAATPRAGPAR